MNAKHTPKPWLVRDMGAELLSVERVSGGSRTVKNEDGVAIKEPLATSDPTVSVIVPVYNEERAIKEVVHHIQEIMLQTGDKCEIVVVDDGSTDRSSEIIETLEGTRCIKHSRNLGYGAALKTGIRSAKGNLIIITDGDGTYPNEVMPELIRDASEYDMVVGARAKNDHNIPFIRKPVKWFLGKLANYLAETEIPDLNSGLRVFKKDVALRFYKILPSGFSFTTTITLAMHCNGYNVKYVPIEYHQRHGKSKIRPIHDTINFVQLILRTIMYFNPLKIFLPLASIILVAFLLSAMIDIFILDNFTDKTVMLLLAFLQVIVVGLLADLIEKRTS